MVRKAKLPNKNTIGKGEYGIPDLDNECYIRIDSQLFEALYKYSFTANQFQFLMFLIRKTYGWQKVEEYITLKNIQDEIGIDRSYANKIIKQLEEQNVIKTRIKKVVRQGIDLDSITERRFFKINKKWKTWGKNVSQGCGENHHKKEEKVWGKSPQKCGENYHILIDSITDKKDIDIVIPSFEGEAKNNPTLFFKEPLKDGFTMEEDYGTICEDPEPLKVDEPEETKEIPLWKQCRDQYRKWAKEYRTNTSYQEDNAIKESSVFKNFVNTIGKFDGLDVTSFGRHEYIKWVKRFMVDTSNRTAMKTCFGNPCILFQKEWIDYFKEYWELCQSARNKNVADAGIIEALDEIYEKKPIEKTYKLTGYVNTLTMLKNATGYPIAPWHLKEIVNRIVEDTTLTIFDIPKVYKWQKLGVFNIPALKLINREFNEDESLLALLIATCQEARKTNSQPREWISKNEKKYRTKTLLKEYGYDKYFKEATFGR